MYMHNIVVNKVILKVDSRGNFHSNGQRAIENKSDVMWTMGP